jgi:putative Holliday junction resolvase
VGVALAIDPGERRTGIATCDPDGILATPLLTHDRKTDGSLIDLVERLCQEHGARTVVVGHAVTQSGERAVSAQRSERVAERLRERLSRPAVQVVLFDERYSSAEARRLLMGRRHEKGDRDALAAALILQAWLDSRRGGQA